MIKLILTFYVACLCILKSLGQDLNANVQVTYPQISTTDKRPMVLLEAAIRNFLNNQQWSTDTYLPHERIDCAFIININQWDGASNFNAEAQIQIFRPVFNTSYNTVTLLVSDKNFNFSYVEGQDMSFSDQVFTNNLSALLAYYAYLIIGLDNDTFSRLGGTLYYIKAQNVLNHAEGSGFPGWRAIESNFNRYWLINCFTDQSYTPLRELWYTYHRQGLDVMAEDQVKGRSVIISSLAKLHNFTQQRSDALLTQLFFTAKADELVDIMKHASVQERIQTYNLLAALDPSNRFKYQQLKPE